MIYVPNTQDYQCFVVLNNTTIRAYKQIPRNNTTVNYRDYYYTSNYLYQDGSQSFSNYSTLPTCLSNNVLTDEVYYRNDFDSILIIFLILCIICFVVPWKILCRFFRRFN